jgi:hypothetical protein
MSKNGLNEEETTLLRALALSFQDARENGKTGVNREELQQCLRDSFSVSMEDEELLEGLENLDLNKELVHFRWSADPGGSLWGPTRRGWELLSEISSPDLRIDAGQLHRVSF